MEIQQIENRLRGINIVLGALQSASRDICKNCIQLEGAKIKMGKMIKKLGMDLDAASICFEKTKADLQTRIDTLSKVAEELEVAEECTCQKTAKNCKIGEGCLINASVDLMKLVQ